MTPKWIKGFNPLKKLYAYKSLCFYYCLFLYLVSCLYHVLCCCLCQMQNNSNLHHTEIKDIVAGSGGCSIPACIATAGTSLVIGLVSPPSKTTTCSLTLLHQF
ncbi:hypothetical protein V8G54_035971 [Vigna mungo]|uniref:Uncharacterized protein n=1 Tax=Vigna mungo TaxID=3915 RepID=A0AAQ3MG26_VIGMU